MYFGSVDENSFSLILWPTLSSGDSEIFIYRCGFGYDIAFEGKME